MNPTDLAHIFDAKDQVEFARLTGDRNPIHLDSLFARRTQAGAPIIHGMNLLLWLLDVVAARHVDMPALSSLNVRFKRLVYVGEKVTASIVSLGDTSIRANILSGDMVVLELDAMFGAVRSAPKVSNDVEMSAVCPNAPVESTIEKLQTQSGYLALAAPAVEIAKVYPHAAKWLGARRIAALGCTSRLVGMVLPGLYSLYSSASFVVCDDNDPDERIAFKLASFEPRFRRVRTSICGAGVAGTVEAFLRQPHAMQLAIEAVASKVSRSEFANTHALVVGGSRGLGELTAKLLAAGGASVTITYSAGKSDAESIVNQIRIWGGTCEAVALDVRDDVRSRLDGIGEAPSHLYYFASPTIFRQRNGVFDQERFDGFNAHYISGFYRVFDTCFKRRPNGITAFYPSSVAVGQRQSNMTEYAMSKAAGERLCADINAQLPKARILVSRLPRLSTDQTATLLPVPTEDSLPLMVQIVRNVQSGRPDLCPG
jgi:acyl dehydratase